MLIVVFRRASHPINLVHTMRNDMADAGFMNFRGVNYKCPVGPCAKAQMCMLVIRIGSPIRREPKRLVVTELR